MHPIPRQRSSAISDFWSSVFMPTPFSAKRPNSAWEHIWGGACFRRSAMPLHLHEALGDLSATAEFVVLADLHNYARTVDPEWPNLAW